MSATLKSLPKCGCGRTMPPPMPCIWPATVFCPCGARRNFPRMVSSRQAEASRVKIKKANESRRVKVTQGGGALGL